jgi:hypothetical protein
MSTDSARPTQGNSSPYPLDRSLVELRSGRRLEKVIISVESFLLNHVARVKKSLDQCQLTVDQNRILQRVMADFQRQKAEWEIDRQAEIRRLFEASEKLAAGWRRLEAERQAWSAEHRRNKDR